MDNIPQYDSIKLDGLNYNNQVAQLLSEVDYEGDIGIVSEILSDRIKFNDRLDIFIINDYSDELSRFDIITYQDLWESLYEVNDSLLGYILLDISSQLPPKLINHWNSITPFYNKRIEKVNENDKIN